MANFLVPYGTREVRGITEHFRLEQLLITLTQELGFEVELKISPFQGFRSVFSILFYNPYIPSGFTSIIYQNLS